MSAIPKRKMCWNCEGNIAVDENHCPYCGVFQNPFGHSNEPQTEKENNTKSLFHIPEAPVVTSGLFSPEKEPQEPSLDKAGNEEHNVAKQVIQEAFRLLKPLVLLLVGISALLFAFLLYFFGQGGVFTLQWNADLWYFYCLIAAPALWRGWHALQLLPDTVEEQ